MDHKDSIKMAIVGAGSMGRLHARDIHELANTELAAVCDTNRAQADQIAAQYGVKAWYDYQDLLAEADLEVLLIVTPHYYHPPISIAALQQGVHVLVEKPMAVHTKDARRMIRAYKAAQAGHPDLVFAAMFMMRTYGPYRKIKDLIHSGDLGRLVRTTWIITDQFRTQIYYNSGGWRATWAGKGGEVAFPASRPAEPPAHHRKLCQCHSERGPADRAGRRGAVFCHAGQCHHAFLIPEQDGRYAH